MDLDKAIELALNNTLKEGLTDIFDRPFEVKLLRSPPFSSLLAVEVRKRLKSGHVQGLKVRSIQHVLFPKKQPFDFRRAALVDPLDSITYLALVLTIADTLEKRRPALRKKVVYSYRFHPNGGYLFNPNYNFTSFEKHVREKTKSSRVKVLVKCDISNYYDRLNLHRLESALSGSGVPLSTTKLVNELLTFWANRDSYSIPVGGNASRILAEAALAPVDDYLLSHGVKFCRFVDDYRFFARSMEEANVWLTLFVERLQLEGLSINPAKTSLEDVSSRSKDTDVALALPRTVSGSGRLSEAAAESIPMRLIAGYSGLVPTKFRELSEREIEDLTRLDLGNELVRINSGLIVDPDSFRRLLRMIVAKGEFAYLSRVTEVLDGFPQFVPYYVDICIKKAESIGVADREQIANYFRERISVVSSVPEYILMAVVKLFGSKEFVDKEALLSVFRDLKRNAGAYIGRCVLDALHPLVSRNDAVELRMYFDRADLWERRALIRVVNDVLSEDEARPWLKNVKVHSADDYFAIESFSPAVSKKKR